MFLLRLLIIKLTWTIWVDAIWIARVIECLRVDELINTRIVYQMSRLPILQQFVQPTTSATTRLSDILIKIAVTRDTQPWASINVHSLAENSTKIFRFFIEWVDGFAGKSKACCRRVSPPEEVEDLLDDFVGEFQEVTGVNLGF
jgi:hypothetical protein